MSRDLLSTARQGGTHQNALPAEADKRADEPLAQRVGQLEVIDVQ